MNTKQHFGKAVEAVSPVVATLLLVLVAAGAAIGFGVFLNGFQKDTQENVSSDAPVNTMTIGGSTTLYDFSAAAKTAWEAAHPSSKIDLQRGGSGAGLAAVCAGNIDIGSSSDDPTLLGAWSNCPDLNADGKKDAGATPHLTKVALDAIVMITNKATTGATPCTFTQAQVIELYLHNLGVATATSTIIAPGPVALGTDYTWAHLAAGPDGVIGTGGDDICPTTLSTGAVRLVERSDNGGTEADFCIKVLAKNALLCDQSTFQLVAHDVEKSGNDGIGAFVGDTADHMGFTDNGQANNPAKAYNAKITVAKLGTTYANAIQLTGNTGNSKTAIQNCDAGTAPSPTSYVACRRMYYITAGAPIGDVRAYLDYVTSTDNNIAFANAALFTPLY